MKVLVVDRDHRRRADLAFRLSGRGIYAAPHDPSDPFTAHRGELALLACHDPVEDREEALAFLQRFGPSSLLIFYSDEVVLSHVVAAMQRGALSYFQWPSDVDGLVELIAWTVTTAAAGSAVPTVAASTATLPASGPANGSAPNGHHNGNGNGNGGAHPNPTFLTPDPVRLGLVTRKADAQARLGTLSRREMEVLRLVATGHSSSQIGEMLNISRRTVESHRSSILNKTQSQSTAQVLRWAIEGEVI